MKLLAIPGSHPCAAVAAMLDAKGIPYERIDLFPAFSRIWLRLAGFAAGTVPAAAIDGVRVQGSRAIARALDAYRSEPPLFPSDAAARFRIERIEKWGDGPLQDVARRIGLRALIHSRPGVRSALGGARLQFRFPVPLAAQTAWPILRLDAFLSGASADAVRADLTALPGLLDRIEAWITAGDLGIDPPTAADYQIAGSLRLLAGLDDLSDLFADRPAVVELARRVIPVFSVRVPVGALPADWLPSAAASLTGAG